MIDLIGGRPGDGKGQYLAWIADRAIRQGRPVYADFQLVGARPWIAFEDIATPAFRGALFLSDEIGSQFNARATLDIDLMVFAAATQHRKFGVDVKLVAQSWQFVDVTFRRIVHRFSVCRRFGPDASRALVRERKKWVLAKREGQHYDYRVHWWERPWAFQVTHFNPPDVMDNGTLNPFAEPAGQTLFLYSARRSALYNTNDPVMPRELTVRYDELRRSSWARASVPVMQAGMSYQYNMMQIAANTDLILPNRESMRETLKTSKGGGSVIDFVEARGFYRPNMPDEDEMPTTTA